MFFGWMVTRRRTQKDDKKYAKKAWDLKSAGFQIPDPCYTHPNRPVILRIQEIICAIGVFLGGIAIHPSSWRCYMPSVRILHWRWVECIPFWTIQELDLPLLGGVLLSHSYVLSSNPSFSWTCCWFQGSGSTFKLGFCSIRIFLSNSLILFKKDVDILDPPRRFCRNSLVFRYSLLECTNRFYELVPCTLWIYIFTWVLDFYGMN